MTRPLKSATTVAEQIALLRSRGLEVDDELACQWLMNVSYYRLSAYWYPARQLGAENQRTDRFISGISFSNVADLYEADRKLRTLVHDGIERVEIALRTRVGEILCVSDPLAYTRPERFRSSFRHYSWMETARKRVERAAKNNEAVKHYRKEYDGRYPFWVLAEVLDFSDISRLFDGLPTRDQRAIAEGLGFVIDLNALSRRQRNKVQSQSPLARWLEQLTVIRNICAHHGRLWNKSFTPVSTVALKTQPQFADLPEGQSERIFGALLVMAQILGAVSPGTHWQDKVNSLINDAFLTNPLVTGAALGMPVIPNLGWRSSL
ncbi:Abi family protein [Dermabacteraceae bacterium P13147]